MLGKFLGFLKTPFSTKASYCYCLSNFCEKTLGYFLFQHLVSLNSDKTTTTLEINIFPQFTTNFDRQGKNLYCHSQDDDDNNAILLRR